MRPAMPEDARTMETQILGRTVRFDYSEHWVGWSVILLRLGMGWVLFWGGIDKLREGLDGLQPRWSADGFLTFAIDASNPFKDSFAGMTGPVTDFLVVWGLTLTGLCLLLGVLVRFAALWGAVMMFLFYLVAWEGWFRIAHGWVVDDHVVYMLLLFGLGAFGAGRILGLDARLERTPLVQRNAWLRWVLG